MKSTLESRPSYRAGPFIVDGRAGEVSRDGIRLPLSGTYFDVWYQLVERRGDVVLRHEFKRWNREGSVDQRNPVDMAITVIRSQLGESVIETVRGKGYRLSRRLSVEFISSPSRLERERRLAVAIDQIGDHSGPSFRAAIANCEELLKAGKTQDAYAAVALAYINLGHVGFCRELPSTTISKARKILAEALRFYPTLGSAYALRGLTSLIYEFDWRNAEVDFRKSLELSPENELGHCFLAHLLIGKGMFAEGLAHARRAAEIDYESPMTVVTEPWLMMFAGQTAEAIEKGEQVVGLFGQCAPAHSILGHVYRAAGETERAITQYNRALDVEFLPEALASLGFIYGREGKRSKAMRCLELIYAAKKKRRIAYVSGYFNALVFAGLGEKKRALDSLDKAFTEKCDWLVHMRVEPRWEELRSEPRFISLMKLVGFSPQRMLRAANAKSLTFSS